MAPPLEKDAIQRLREDWIGEALNERPEDITKYKIQCRISDAKERSAEDEEDPGALLDLAEAYGLLHPTDKRCRNVCERLMKLGAHRLDFLQQGRAHQLHGRCLFLDGDLEGSLQALLRARACWKENGTKALRRQNNAGMLRVYAALGKSNEAAERLEVAFTLCEKGDDCMHLYMDAKSALEYTGVPRDIEVLDDIWYVWLDTHPDVKEKFESYQQMCNGMAGKLLPEMEEPPPEITWANVKIAIRETLADKQLQPLLQTLFTLFCFTLTLYVVLKLRQ